LFFLIELLEVKLYQTARIMLDVNSIFTNQPTVKQAILLQRKPDMFFDDYTRSKLQHS